MYSLLFKNTAVKSIEKLSEKDKQKVARVLESLTTNPFSGKKLAGEYKDLSLIHI
jgi:mRNA-degrading endonuclease RelE of RelBE toxin-antitoxin system